jgi:diguanylate cyclase (GGDEF)-like protein
MPGLDAEQAVKRADEIQMRIRSLRVQQEGVDLGPVTSSFGLASAPDHCAFDKLMQMADSALLRAKDTGRDRIVVAERRRFSVRAA